jgi:hypothetical protein
LYFSGEYRDQLGSLSNNESVQRSLRANFNLIPTPTFDVAISASYANNRVLLPDNDNNTAGYIGVGMLGSAWGSRIQRADLGLGTDVATCPLAYEMQRAIYLSGIPTDGIPTPTLEELSDDYCPENPFFAERTFDDIRTLSNAQDIDRFTTSVAAQYRPRTDLTTKVTLGYDQFVDQTGFLVPVDLDLPFGADSRGFRGSQHSTNRILTIDANAIYAYQLDSDLRSTTTVGAQFLRRKTETVGATGRTLPLGSGTVSGAVRTTGGEAVGESRVLGLIVEEQVSFRDRLFVTPAVRFDDSSAFGRNLGRAAYPRVGLSYVISEEPWFADLVPGSFLTSLRLRGSWGQSGRQPAAFAALKLLATRRVTLQDEDVVGLVLAGPGNPELKGERGEEIELGFEASAFDGRFGVEFTWYRKTTKDAIVGRDLAPSTGYAAPIFSNVGEVRNQGAEVEVTGLILNAERLRWDAQVRISGNTNRIVKLDEPIIYGLGRDSQRLQEGYPFGAYFSRIYQVAASGAVASSDSSVYVGQPAPTVEGSAMSSVTFAGWATLSAQMGYALGFQQFNSTQFFRCTAFGGGQYGGLCPELYATEANGEPTAAARLKQAAGDDLEIAPWIESADFFRLRSVSLRLEIPAGWLGRIRASGGSFTLAGENLLLFTNYTGADPEVNFAGGDLTLRAEFFTLPPAKRLTGRLSLSF